MTRRGAKFADTTTAFLNMKNLALPLLLLFCVGLNAQNLPKKYVLLEHFTNSKCPICASKNPAFYNLIANYPDDVHHIAYHPPIPYNTCVFYLDNPTENSGRASVYSINGTPRVALNGSLAPVSGALLQQALLTAEIGETSPLSLSVTETGAGNARTVKIKAKSWATVPSGNYRIFAAVVEKTVNYNAPNGETVHHNVFRKMLPSLDGGAFQPPAAGQEIEYTYDYTIASGWVASEIYVVAFVQNLTNGEVLNSGTRFDAPVSSGVSETARLQPLQLTPNPVSAQAIAWLPDDNALTVEVFNSAGQPVATERQVEAGQVKLFTEHLPAGVYFVKIQGEKGAYAGRMVKI